MRVLIYAPLAVLGHHFETDLEIVEKHIAAGDDVTVIGCSGQLRSLEFYACQGVLRCEHCISRRKQGYAALTNSSRVNFKMLPEIKPRPVNSTLDLTNHQAVKSYTYRGSDIGSAYMSSLISDIGDPEPDMAKYAAKTKSGLELLAGLTEAFESIVDENRPDLVYVFNGRFSIYRPLIRICENRKIKYFSHERGANLQKYSLTEDDIPQSIDAITKKILAAWTDPATSFEEKSRIGSEWYEARARGVIAAWRSFTDQQRANLLPSGWKSENKNIVFFPSSENEFMAVPGYGMTIFSSQFSAIDEVCEKFQGQPEFQFFVRMHPNMKGLRNRSINQLYSLETRHSNCTVIAPESPISTYSLIKSASQVFAFNSTVGIEAVYWGTPSISLAKSSYMHLGGVVLPKTKAEVFDIIANQSVPPGPREAAVKFGYWGATNGFPFDHYKPVNLTTGTFNGRRITGSKVLMFTSYFSVLMVDIAKIFKGQYSFFQLREKIRNKLSLFRISREA